MLIKIYNFFNHLKSTPARKNKVLIGTILFGIIINLCIWLIIVLKLKPLIDLLPNEQASIPLHYNIYLGIDSFGTWTMAFIRPALGLLFLFINSFVAFLIYYKRELLSYFLVFSAVLIQLILLVATILIILINI